MTAQSKKSEPKPPIDWAAVHERLAAAHSGSQDDSGPARRAADRAILVARARKLAAPVRETIAPLADLISVVVFSLGAQVFALPAAYVRETVIPRDLTRLPGVPPFLRGLVNIRSRVVAAFDFRSLLQLPPVTGTTAEKLLLVAIDGTEWGVLVDAVIGLRDVSAASLRTGVPGLNHKYVRGITEDGLIVLDLAALLPDLAVDDGTDS